MENKQIIFLSWSSIFKVFAVAFLFYLIWFLKDVITWFVLALLLSFLLNPIINFFHRLKIPRIIATIIVYFTLVAVISYIIYFSVPFIITEIQKFSVTLPMHITKASPFLERLGIEIQYDLQLLTKNLLERTQQISAGVFGAISIVFGGMFSTFFILSMAFFISLEEQAMTKFLVLVFPKKYEETVIEIYKDCQRKVSGWIGARLIISIIIGIATYILLIILDIQYAFILSILACILNFIPYLGPVITGVILIIFALITSIWWKVIIIAIVFTIIQQLDGNVITPILTNKIIGLPPIFVLLAIIIGGPLFGLVLGAILSIPLAGIAYELGKKYFTNKKKKENDLLNETENKDIENIEV
jgi:predicted PurR-regulated permease PerM